MYASFTEQDMGLSPEGKEILDVGAGMGTPAINLATFYPAAHITAIDVDKEAIAFAQKHNNAPNITYRVANFFTFPVTKYDYIFALEIYEHLPPLLHTLFIDKCLDSLKVGGKLFITTPNEPFSKDGLYGHIGFLNGRRVEAFVKRYEKNILSSSFINNKKLHTGEVAEFVIGEPVERFLPGYSPKSHFKLVLGPDGERKLSIMWKLEIVVYSAIAFTTLFIRRLLVVPFRIVRFTSRKLKAIMLRKREQ
jgi:SAM-dependent methyltransferase